MNLACFALLFQLQFLFLKEYPAGALAEEGVIITLKTMLKRHVFKNYDVFLKSLSLGLGFTKSFNSVNKIYNKYYLKSNSKCGQFVSANNTLLPHQGNSSTIRLLYNDYLSYE